MKPTIYALGTGIYECSKCNEQFIIFDAVHAYEEVHRKKTNCTGVLQYLKPAWDASSK